MASAQRPPRKGTWVFAPFVLLGAYLAFELGRPDVLLVGNITVDLVDGTTPTGGAVSYAAVLANALQARTCVVTGVTVGRAQEQPTHALQQCCRHAHARRCSGARPCFILSPAAAVAGPEADLTVFDGSDLNVIRSNETLTFEHTYTWWGHSRKLRVTANPNITISRQHVPMRCRFARVVLLGPLTLHDVDAASFARPDGWWDDLLSRGQLVGLMAQGFQRELGPEGQVLPLPEPSRRLLDGLGGRSSLFLSDVETDTWSQQQLQQVVARTARVVITQGENGALLIQGGSSSSSSSSSSSEPTRIPVFKVPGGAVDTNGAGDTFATAFMLSLMRRHPDPGASAAWAASRAVMQPQTCKPQCAPDLVRAAPGILPPISHQERLGLAVAPLLQRLQGLAAAAVGRGPCRSQGAAGQQQQGLGWLLGQLPGGGVLQELAGGASDWLRGGSSSSSSSRSSSSE